jgi:hypothetical protein
MSVDQVRADLSTALYLAGALETYIQFMERADPESAQDNETLQELRKVINPAVEELRAIRHRAAGLVKDRE